MNDYFFAKIVCFGYLELDSELDQKATSTNYVNNKSDKL